MRGQVALELCSTRFQRLFPLGLDWAAENPAVADSLAMGRDMFLAAVAGHKLGAELVPCDRSVEDAALRFFEVVCPAGREAALRFAFWATLCRVPAACLFGARAELLFQGPANSRNLAVLNCLIVPTIWWSKCRLSLP